MPYYPNLTGLSVVTAVSGTDPGLASRVVDQVASSSYSSVVPVQALTTLLPENLGRLGAAFYFVAPASNELFLQLGAFTSGSFTISMAGNSYFELPRPAYTGVIRGRFKNASTGTLHMTEFV